MMMMRSQMFFGPRSGVRRGPFLKVVIFEFQRGMLYREGRFIRVLEPGRYLLRARDTLVRPVDIRPAFVTIPGQEVLSSDGVTLKVSIVAQYEVADLDVAFNKTQDAMSALYLTLQMALRDIVGGAKIDELLGNRSRFAEGLLETATEPIAIGKRRFRSSATWANSHLHHCDATEWALTRNSTVSELRTKSASSRCHSSP